MPALIVRKKIVPLNAKIEGPYIGLTLTLNAAHTWNVSRCGGPSPFHSNGGGAFTLICALIGDKLACERRRPEKNGDRQS